MNLRIVESNVTMKIQINFRIVTIVVESKPIDFENCEFYIPSKINILKKNVVKREENAADVFSGTHPHSGPVAA